MIKKCLRLFAAALVFTMPAIAIGGDCSQLAVTTTNNGDTSNVAFDVTGSAPLSFHAIVIGDTTGDTTFNLGGTTLTLGLVPPFFALPLGVSDANGDLSVDFDVPTGLGAWNGQSLGIEFVPPSLGFCTSNVASFSL